MYAALYDELEKVRNMLLIQNNINQKQSSEVGCSSLRRDRCMLTTLKPVLQITLLQEEMDNVKVRYEAKLKDMRDKVVEKQKRVLLLEEQIRSIAYGTQKPIPLKAVVSE